MKEMNVISPEPFGRSFPFYCVSFCGFLPMNPTECFFRSLYIQQPIHSPLLGPLVNNVVLEI